MSRRSGYLIQNQDFGRRKIWILKRKSRFGGFRRWRFQIFRSRNKIREKMEKPILDFWKWISWCQIPNSKSKSWFWGVKFWFWMTFFESKFLKNRNFKFWQNSCPISSSNFQNFDEIYKFYAVLGSIYTIFLKFRLPEYPKILFAKFFFNHIIVWQIFILFEKVPRRFCSMRV